VAQKQTVGKRELAMRMLDPRERQFTRDLTNFFTQARWILTIQQFPDGKPLVEQTPWQLRMWSIFIDAIEARKAGAVPAPADAPEAPGE